MKGSLFCSGHSLRLRLSQSDREILSPPKFCLCGCGQLVNGAHNIWYKGHQHHGIDGYNKRREYKNKRDGTGQCEGRGPYPSIEEIIQAHLSIIQELKLNPHLCWGCQNYEWSQKAHIVAVSDGGENEASNLILLCDLCHNIQHAWSFRTFNWNIQKQYDWLRMMRNWEWGNPLLIYFEKHAAEFMDTERMGQIPA